MEEDAIKTKIPQLRVSPISILLVVGVVLLIMGAGLAYYYLLPTTTPVSTPIQKSETLYDDTFTVESNDYVVKSYSIPANRIISGNFLVSKGHRDLAYFAVMDKHNYDEHWHGGRGVPEYIIYKENVIKYSFSFTTNATDKYYFIFNNKGVMDRDVEFKLTSTWTEVETTYKVSYNLPMAYAGGALAVVGLGLIHVGMFMYIQSLKKQLKKASQNI
ncbi:hypothetical protein KEJ26_04670 [Candidatus Bathyarchaeota archaeon]|nr:hypothetical protein [Candidatus Bathyarchaeota archaeon]